MLVSDTDGDSSGLQDIDTFLSENYRLFAIAGVFAGLTAYFRQIAVSTDSTGFGSRVAIGSALLIFLLTLVIILDKLHTELLNIFDDVQKHRDRLHHIPAFLILFVGLASIAFSITLLAVGTLNDTFYRIIDIMIASIVVFFYTLWIYSTDRVRTEKSPSLLDVKEFNKLILLINIFPGLYVASLYSQMVGIGAPSAYYLFLFGTVTVNLTYFRIVIIVLIVHAPLSVLAVRVLDRGLPWDDRIRAGWRPAQLLDRFVFLRKIANLIMYLSLITSISSFLSVMFVQISLLLAFTTLELPFPLSWMQDNIISLYVAACGSIIILISLISLLDKEDEYKKWAEKINEYDRP